MLIDYFLTDGQNIKFDTNGGILSHSDVNRIADMVATVRPDTLPTHVWLRADVYKDFAIMLGKSVPIAIVDGQPCLLLLTGCGLLTVKPLPYSFSKFNVMVGTQEDYNHYFLDEIFEETVLKDCESE